MCVVVSVVVVQGNEKGEGKEDVSRKDSVGCCIFCCERCHVKGKHRTKCFSACWNACTGRSHLLFLYSVSSGHLEKFIRHVFNVGSPETPHHTDSSVLVGFETPKQLNFFDAPNPRLHIAAIGKGRLLDHLMSEVCRCTQVGWLCPGHDK